MRGKVGSLEYTTGKVERREEIKTAEVISDLP